MGRRYSPAEASASESAHVQRARRWTDPHLNRRARGMKHPVWDFLFDYYPIRAAQLTRWHPGLGSVLVQASSRPHASYPYYAVSARGDVQLDRCAFLEHRGKDMERIRTVLSALETRTAQFGCFGMHEWAMVYRSSKPRHTLPLRLGERATNDVVDANHLRCTHFDAYRFFTPEAKPLNVSELEPGLRTEHDQPGCVHVCMDTYKWAAKMGPVVPGNVLLDAFELAVSARRLDMEASPYDCRALGFDVIPVETAEGKAEYVARQRALAADAAPVRRTLISLLDDLLSG